MYLMYKNIEILYFDFADFLVIPIIQNLLPFSLRGLNYTLNDKNSIMYRVSCLKNYFSSRVLNLSRTNAKTLYTLFQLEQKNDIETRVKICMKCKGVSIQDNYWIKEDNETKNWSDINIRTNPLSKILNISLYGDFYTKHVNPICPELTTKGIFPKCWIREKNILYLLKTDNTLNQINTRMEVLASQILSCFNVPYIKYTGRIRRTTNSFKYIDKSKNFVTEDLTFVEASEIIEYCKHKKINYENFCLENFGSKFANIPVITYIIMNTDLHTENYGFLVDNNCNLVDIAPLYDFNQALVSDYFKKTVEDTLSQMFNINESIYNCMKRYLPYSNLNFNNDRFQKMRFSNTKYKYIFDSVYKRIEHIGLV